jgi:hypothetical protein
MFWLIDGCLNTIKSVGGNSARFAQSLFGLDRDRSIVGKASNAGVSSPCSQVRATTAQMVDGAASPPILFKLCYWESKTGQNLPKIKAIAKLAESFSKPIT